VKKLIVLCAMLLSTVGMVPLSAMAAGDGAKPAAAASQAPLNLNQATAKQLEALPGVGKVTAEQIVAYRTEKGPFASVEDLGKVKGIGPKTLDKLRPLVAVR
jgi:competence protein ComEA